MSGEQSDEIYEGAYELYKEIRDEKGLHLRHDGGRDEILIEELSNSIGCPDDQIAEFLKEEEEGRTAEWLMREFFQLAAPFARMFTDIWEFLSNRKAPKATEDLRVRFGFDDDDFTDVELDEFREWAETARKISVGANVAFWSSEALHDLFDFLRYVDLEGQSHSDYRPGEPYELPVIETHHNDDFEKIIRRVRTLFQNIVDSAAENGNADSDRYHYEVESAEQNSLPSPDIAASVLHDLLPGWEFLFENHHEVSKDNRREAVEFFQNTIDPKIELEGIIGFQKYQSPLDILRLPFWKHRWHTYEIWMTVQTLRALDSYDPQVNDEDGRIPIDGRDTAIVADLERIQNHDACVVSELETPHEMDQWESMRPDLSICRTRALDKESRAIVIEYKQRSPLRISHINEVTEKYLTGASEAVGLVVVNYDDTPDVELPEEAELIANVRPNSPTVAEYRNLVQELMIEANLFDSLQRWTVLVDVSGSMNDKYLNQNVKEALLNLLELMAPSPRVYKFNEGITQNPQITVDEINAGLQTSGRTDVETAIEELYEEHESTKNLLIVTDKNYPSPSSLPEELETKEECFPQDLSAKLDKLR